MAHKFQNIINANEDDQLLLLDFSEKADDSLVRLELKPYIQPFEQILARAELAGLLTDVSIDDPFDKFAKGSEELPTKMDVEFLKKRLTYWQKLGRAALKPTLQVLYESSGYSTNNGDSLPKNRRLRYGPHDIHEYRGKFFPQLVKSLINFSGIPEGSVVIDPFCGSGTTNCETRALGMESIGIDLNPLSVLISRVKSGILQIEPDELQEQTKKFLSQLHPSRATSVTTRWTECDLNYLNRWFDERAIKEMSIILDVIDQNDQCIISDWWRVCLSNIIRRVSWQRETDLRVRKDVKDYSGGDATWLFKQEVRRQLMKIVPYLNILQETIKPSDMPSFDIREGDVRHIHEILESKLNKCDLLITSPPYAMALPYIDTDRLSLIVLGLLPRKEHRRRELLMAGNREILESQRQGLWKEYQERRLELPDVIHEFIDKLANSYHNGGVGFRRRNLPALLSKYFLDMLDVMQSSIKMMRPESYAFFVVGNNSTCINGENVEIPTDKFLWEIGKKSGWHQVKMIDMELLPSRDIFCKNRGTAENILVFTSTLKRTSIYSHSNHHKYEVDNSEWDFAEDDTQEHLHTLHPYPARFIPQIPRKAILEYSVEGDVVFDPFCGCGTTLLESILLGRSAIGVDNNEVACLISRAKVASYSKEHIQALQEFAIDLYKRLPKSGDDLWVPDYENINYWFDEVAIKDLSRARAAIDELSDPLRTFALAVFSAIIVRASYQDSDTRYSRVKKTYIPGSAIGWFQSKLFDNIGRLKEVLDKPKANVQVHLADARNISFMDESTVDLIVTSPPYLNAYDYHKYHRHRLHWINADVRFARDEEIGKHDVFTRPGAKPTPYFDDITKCFKEWERILRKDGKALIVIGDAIVSGESVPVADRFIEIMGSLNLELEKRWIRRLQKEKKSFNRNSRIDREHVLLFKKH